MSAGVTLSAQDVAQLRRYLAREADESLTPEQQHQARVELCGYLPGALGAAPSAEPDHLDRAADLVLAVVANRDPAYPATTEAHDAMVNLLDSIVSALLVERRDR